MRSLVVAIAVTPLLVAASRPPAPPAPAPESPEGGALFICVASGILFGASILSGNALGAAGAVVSAIHNDCI